MERSNITAEQYNAMDRHEKMMAISQLTLFESKDLMMCADHYDRLIGETVQVSCRVEGLVTMLEKYKAGKLDFTPTCPIELLEEQRDAMITYRNILIHRLSLEEGAER